MKHPTAPCARCGYERVVKPGRDTQLCMDCRQVEADVARIEAERYAKCGTAAGYKRHWRAGELACDDCLAAHTANITANYRKRGVKPRPVAKCGTEGGYRRHRIVATDTGIAALGADYEPLPTGAALRDYWLTRLSGGEAALLGHLIDAYPDGLTGDDLGDRTDYKRSSPQHLPPASPRPRAHHHQRRPQHRLRRPLRPGAPAMTDALFDVSAEPVQAAAALTWLLDLAAQEQPA